MVLVTGAGTSKRLAGIRRAVSLLQKRSGHVVKGISYPFDRMGPGIEDLRREGLRLSVLMPRVHKTPDEEVCGRLQLARPAMAIRTGPLIRNYGISN
jgi:hypothetical protein